MGTYDGPYTDIEDKLGHQLPKDYKDFWRHYGVGNFYDQFYIFHPCDLVEKAREASEILNWMELDETGEGLWPGPGQRIPFGLTYSGEYYCWKTHGRPEEWTIALLERWGEWEDFGIGLSQYLVRLADLGQTPDEWLHLASTLRGRGVFEPRNAEGRIATSTATGPYRNSIRREAPQEASVVRDLEPPRPPGEMRLLELVRLASPPLRPEYPFIGPWEEIEDELNVRLPQDYKDYCRVYGNDRTVVLPRAGPDDRRLTDEIAYQNELLRRVEGLDALGFKIWPEPGGLLYFGGTERRMFWKTDGAPEDWTVVVWLGDKIFETFDTDMTGYLSKLIRDIVYVYR